jgi:dynein heavy chain
LERRYNYTTPKSFLELISFYKKLLAAKRKKVKLHSKRVEKIGNYTPNELKRL